MDAFNTPVEVGARLLTMLVEAHPRNLDINQLVLLDHALIHSADVGGPASLHPPTPLRVSELGIKRAKIEPALSLLIRTGLADVGGTKQGIEYRASEGSGQFLALLEAPYAHELALRAGWVVERFGDLDSEALRREMRAVFNTWSEEFEGKAPGSEVSK